MVFDEAGPMFYADHLAMIKHGIERTVFEFIKRMRQAVAIYKRTSKRIFFRKFPYSDQLANRYRYPPRIFVEHQPSDFSDSMTFIVGHTKDGDRRKLLHAIDQWNGDQRFRCREVKLGSDVPVVRNRWDHVRLVRALTKIGLNLLFDTAERTDIGAKTFSAATSFVLTGRGPNPRFLSSCGFVWPEDIAFLRHADGGHAFRLIHKRGMWNVMFSFFGGKAGAFVKFPGPSQEICQCAQGSTPLRSVSRDVNRDWQVFYPKFDFPVNLHVDLGNPNRIVPSLKLFNVQQTHDVPVAVE
jgi:hypothetical protein